MINKNSTENGTCLSVIEMKRSHLLVSFECFHYIADKRIFGSKTELFCNICSFPKKSVTGFWQKFINILVFSFIFNLRIFVNNEVYILDFVEMKMYRQRNIVNK